MNANPIKQARQRFNITQRSLAEQAGISPTAVLRYEQGLYENISGKIFKALLDLDPNDGMLRDLPALYRDWRNIHQSVASGYVHPLPNLQVYPQKHPFITWRETVTRRAVGKDSRISFCILLAIHPSVVLHYEAGKQRHMPKLIQDALINAGVGADYIKSLDDLGAIYYDRTNTSRH